MNQLVKEARTLGTDREKITYVLVRFERPVDVTKNSVRSGPLEIFFNKAGEAVQVVDHSIPQKTLKKVTTKRPPGA